MYTINQDFLYKALGDIVDRIEVCGASPELTNAVSLASDLRQAVGNECNPADPYSLLRVANELASSRKDQSANNQAQYIGHGEQG